MEKMDLFIKLNEECEKYLATYQNNFYIKNLELYGRITNQLLACTPLKNKNIDEVYIDLLEGIELICTYLKEINPYLPKKLIELFTNGQLEINYTDEDIYLEEKTKGSWCHNNHQSYRKIKEEKDEIMIRETPLSLIDIDNKKTTYSLLATIVHEFFHTLIAKDKNKNKETNIANTFSEMISIYYEFDFCKKMIQMGYPKDYFLETYYHRYNDTTDKKELANFQDQTVWIYKKITEEVLDDISYKTGRITCKKEVYEKLMDKTTTFFEKNKEQELFTTHQFAPYIIGSPLAYYLSCSPDPKMPYKMLDFVEEINTLPFLKSLSKIDLSLAQIKHLNYQIIMENMYQEIINIEKNTNNGKEKSLHKI